MANTLITSLWVLLEGKNPRHLRNLSFTTTDPDLSDLALQLGQNFEALTSIDASDLVFFNITRSKELPINTTLKVLEETTSCENPVVVRYRLSETTVFVNLSFSKYSTTSTEISLPHTTGLWYTLLDESRKLHESSEDDSDIYFVDQETGERDIRNEFKFNDFLKGRLGSGGEVNLKLLIKIEGKKRYGDWGIKDMLKDVLRGRYTEFKAIPQFDMRRFEAGDVLNEQEVESFTSNLKKIASVFSMAVTANDATTRNFINPFMVEAVAKVKREYPSLTLAVEQDFEGSRGYGFLDYVVLFQGLAIVITEANMSDIPKGIVQNVVQLHTAAEKRKRKRKREQIKIPSVVYGIVSTANKWVFLRWSGTTEEPTLEISKDYDVSFDGELPGAKEVLSLIIQILRDQASAAMKSSDEANGQDYEEPPLQRLRYE